MRIRIIWLVLLAAAVWPGYATAQDVSGSDRFKFFNECRPMDLVVEDYDDDDDAEAIGLTVARIRTLAESRLRAARLYDADAATWLYVNVNVEARGFSLSVEYKKLLYDAVSGETSYATTGEIGGAGSHGGDAGFILQGLSEYLDGFILDYLRVNESACK